MLRLRFSFLNMNSGSDIDDNKAAEIGRWIGPLRFLKLLPCVETVSPSPLQLLIPERLRQLTANGPAPSFPHFKFGQNVTVKAIPMNDPDLGDMSEDLIFQLLCQLKHPPLALTLPRTA